MPTAETPSQDNRKSSDRRDLDRRRLERRTPPPLWRRPWAFVAYGVLAGIVLVAMFSPGGRSAGTSEPGGDRPIEESDRSVTPPKAAPAPQTPTAVEAAYGAAGFERLTLEGATAVGRRVRTELFCEQPTSFQVRDGVPPEAAIAALAADARVPAAECKWGGPSDPRREDFILLVPPELAAQFTAAPVVTDQFQRRRHIRAEVEWIGRSEALSLRAAGVYRGSSR